MDFKILFVLFLLGNIGSRVSSAPLSTFYFRHYLPQRLPKKGKTSLGVYLKWANVLQKTNLDTYSSLHRYLNNSLFFIDLSGDPVTQIKDVKIPSPATESPKPMKPETTITDDMENMESLRRLGELLNLYGIEKSEFCLVIIKFMLKSNYLNYKCLPNQLIPMHVGQLYHLNGK